MPSRVGHPEDGCHDFDKPATFAHQKKPTDPGCGKVESATQPEPPCDILYMARVYTPNSPQGGVQRSTSLRQRHGGGRTAQLYPNPESSSSVRPSWWSPKGRYSSGQPYMFKCIRPVFAVFCVGVHTLVLSQFAILVDDEPPRAAMSKQDQWSYQSQIRWQTSHPVPDARGTCHIAGPAAEYTLRGSCASVNNQG